jgi:hypothetical protein
MYQDQNHRFARQLEVAPEVFDQPLVALELPADQARRPEAVSAFALAANLLARLFTRLQLVAPDAPLGPHPWRLDTLHQLCDELSSVTDGTVTWGNSGCPDIVLGIGAPPTLAASRSTFVTFNGWLAGLEEAADGTELGVFGALLAACYGTAQTFLHAVNAAGGRQRPMKPFRLSLLDYGCGSTNAATPQHVDIREAHLVGVGAIGSAFVYSLGHIPTVGGKMHLIDNDRASASNLQRYALMRDRDVGGFKTDVAAEILRPRGLQAISYPVSFKDYVAAHTYDVDLLISPVDSEAARRYLASCLPRSVLNAATGQSTVTLSRHGFADGGACLNCLYLQPRAYISTEQRLATDLGLPLAEVVDLLAANRPIDEDIVRRVERHRGAEEGTFRDWVGQHVQSFYQRAVCGEATVQTANGTLSAPLSFISATAGVLLAAELVKSSVPEILRFTLDNYFRVDTLHSPNPSFRERRMQDPTHECICWDRDYIETYREKYSAKA